MVTKQVYYSNGANHYIIASRLYVVCNHYPGFRFASPGANHNIIASRLMGFVIPSYFASKYLYQFFDAVAVIYQWVWR